MKNVNSDIAYDYLRKRILGGEYAPGQALMTNALAPEIGVSRTPIRDALRQLEADGLVTILPRLGASVKKMDLKTFRESCELRLALESHAAGLAARNRSDVDLHEISLALEEMRRITEKLVVSGAVTKLIPQLVREDVRFHLAIIAAGKNEMMKKEILRLHLVNRVVTGPAALAKANVQPEPPEDMSHRRAVLASHEEIYQAIAAGQAAEARRAMEEHIQEIIDRSIYRLARASTEVATRELSAEEAMYSA
ncbi:MAG: GntR family transcriptional regulator [Verrucomicrobiota bacterium]